VTLLRQYPALELNIFAAVVDVLLIKMSELL
jgi:hypothetical protein